MNTRFFYFHFMAIKTAECVSPKHPDKMCDVIADTICDAYLQLDKDSRTAVEVMGGHKLITINGEVTSTGKPDLESLVRALVGQDFVIQINIVAQSPEIARGVDIGGAGDQGIMKGYATAETASFMPREYELARNLCQKIFAVYPFDGKTQVTIVNDKVTAVVASFQNAPTEALTALVKTIIDSEQYYINPAGE